MGVYFSSSSPWFTLIVVDHTVSFVSYHLSITRPEAIGKGRIHLRLLGGNLIPTYCVY